MVIVLTSTPYSISQLMFFSVVEDHGFRPPLLRRREERWFLLGPPHGPHFFYLFVVPWPILPPYCPKNVVF